jgi:streptogramin lyase
LAAVFALLALAFALAAPHAQLSAPPVPLRVGTAWHATLVVRPAPRRAPTVLAGVTSGKAIRFHSTRVAANRFRVVLRLPRAGSWRLSARIGAGTVRLRSVRVVPLPPPGSPLPGATAVRVCGGAAIPYTQNGLALGFGSAWVVCTPRRRVQRITSGRVVASIPLPVEPWAIAAGEGAVWALARDGAAVYRISPATNRVTAHVDLGADGVYLWALAGAVWVADDANRTLIRVDPAGPRVSARLPVGDGPSGLAFDGAHLWLVSHRENSLDRIDPVTNAVTRVASPVSPPETSAAERVAALGGSLWITGRGLDLLRRSPAGASLGTVEVGPAAMDVVTDGSSLWTAAFTATGARRGDPIAGEFLRVDATGGILERVTATRRLFVDGLAAEDGALWLYDGLAGLLVRLPT